jgi:hypothetical protein
MDVTAPQHWYMRIGDGANFKNSEKFSVWGASGTDTTIKGMLKRVRSGDILWFVLRKSKSRIYAMAIYAGHRKRDASAVQPLISPEFTTEELGWKDWRDDSVLFDYTNLCVIESANICAPKFGRSTCALYSPTNLKHTMDMNVVYIRAINWRVQQDAAARYTAEQTD